MMGGKPLSLVWHHLRYYTPTIFEKDLQEWIESVAWEVAKEISAVKKYRREYMKAMEEEEYTYEDEDDEEYEDENENVSNTKHHYEVFKAVYNLAYNIAKEFDEKYIHSKYVLIVKGDFKIGKAPCVLEGFPLSSSFGYEASVEIGRKASEILSRYLPQGREIEVPRSMRNPNLENTLDPPIPAIVYNVLQDWITWVPKTIVRRISDVRVYESNEQTVKELIGSEIEKIIDELVNLGSRYVAITDCELSMHCEGECQIITSQEFIDKLYKSAYINTMEVLNKKSINFQTLDIFYE